MRNLNFLHFSKAMLAARAVYALCLLGARAGARRVDSSADAEKLAVSLANGKCLHEFGPVRAPLKSIDRLSA